MLQTGVPNRALDIGCAVGRSTFELARVVDEAIGIDYSRSFVDACNKMKQTGRLDYSITTEGDLVKQLQAEVASDIVSNTGWKFLCTADCCCLCRRHSVRRQLLSTTQGSVFMHGG
jgi:protein-L-isoaspartate O-methyltransferase